MLSRRFDRMIKQVLVAWLAVFISATSALSDIYVAPRAASPSQSPDGSEANPYATLKAAIQARGNRDVPIILMDGRHDDIKLFGKYAPPLEIRSQTPAGAHTRLIRIEAPGTHVSGLGVWPETPLKKPYDLVTSKADDVVFDGLDMRGNATAMEDYFRWSKQDWLARWRVNGAKLRGRNVVFKNNTITGVAFGIQTFDSRARVLNNRVSGFSGDGLRGLGDDKVFAGNYVENCFDVDKNHDDGFQSWARNKNVNGMPILKNLLLDSNVIIEWNGPANHPLHCTLQGIGLFDGRFENVTVQNNLVVVNHYHGITLTDAFDSKIVNNTVTYLPGPIQPHPWIKLGTKRDDPEAYKHVLIANNAAMSYGKRQDVLRQNVVTKYVFKHYQDPSNFNYQPKSDSPLIGAGFAEFAPQTDILGRSRPSAGRVTAGAFEVQ